MGPILLATDGSEYAQEAAKQAINLAADSDATLHVICVVDQRRFDDPALSSAELATIYAEDHAGVCVDAVVEMAAERNVPVEVDTPHGVPDKVILEYADEIGADTIVIGEHGEHDEHFCGVGKRVVNNSDRTVEVVSVDQ